MNIFKSVIIGVGLILGLSSPVFASSLATIQSATKELYTSGMADASGNAESATCSGEFISPTEYLTAGHCVADNGKVGTSFSLHDVSVDTNLNVVTETHYKLSLVSLDISNDIAILKLQDTSIKEPYVQLAPKGYIPQFGDALFTVGFPRAEGILKTNGEFGSVTKSPVPDISGLFYRTSVPLDVGNSGGGLYANINGQYYLVGLASFVQSDNNNISWFATLDSIDKLLKK